MTGVHRKIDSWGGRSGGFSGWLFGRKKEGRGGRGAFGWWTGQGVSGSRRVDLGVHSGTFWCILRIHTTRAELLNV